MNIIIRLIIGQRRQSLNFEIHAHLVFWDGVSSDKSYFLGDEGERKNIA